MFTERNPCKTAIIPIWYYFTDIFPILLMGIRAIIRTVFPHRFYFPGIFKISVTYQISFMIHCEMSISIIIIRKGNFPIAFGSQFIFSYHCRTIFITTMINNWGTIITPHLMANPVSCLAFISFCISKRILSFRSDRIKLIQAVVIDPNSPDSAIKACPFMVIHNQLWIKRMKLYMRNPAQRNLLFVKKCPIFCIINTKIAA